MPVRNYTKPVRTSEANELLSRLIAEWRSPSEQDDPEVPVVLIEHQKVMDALHIFVVWDGWDELEQVERSGIIMDACTQQLGDEETLKVTVAMGLTRREADRMGIRYQSVPV